MKVGTPIPPERGSAEAGYNLVMLVVLLTLLNVAIAASLPTWSHTIRREREEELIFRGFQYAEAIRLFQKRFQRPPVRLEELFEVEPRSLRQMWKDPMTESGKWSPIFDNQGQTLTPQQVDPDQDGREEEGEDEGEGEEDGGFGSQGIKKGDEIAVGPLKGVRSRSSKKSILIFNGKERYDEWHFTADLLTNPSLQGGGTGMNGPGGHPNAPTGGGLQMSVRWIGRPVPEFLMPRQGNGLPDDDSDGLGRGDGGFVGGSRDGRPRGGTGKP